MNYSQHYELLKGVDMGSVNKNSALACYAAKPALPTCMMSASGEQVCFSGNSAYVDGASAILGLDTATVKPSTCLGTSLEHFTSDYEEFKQKAPPRAFETCLDGSKNADCETTKRSGGIKGTKL